MKKYIRFIGRLNNLKSMGYTFQKMYARNYRCWHKEAEGQAVWIWDKNKEVEIMDLYGLSHIILREVVINGRQGKRYNPDGKIFFSPADRGHYILDLETGTLLDYNRELSLTYLFINPDCPPTDEAISAHSKRYREVSISDELTALLIELIDNKMIEIAEKD